MSFGDEGFQHRRLRLKSIPPECFDMKSNRRLAAGQSFLGRIPFSNHDAFQSQRVCHKTFVMLLDHYFHGVHNRTLLHAPAP